MSYRLSTKDKKVLDAFIMERPLDGKILFSDGITLEKLGLMVGDFAKWINGKIHILSSEGVKSDEVIIRYLIKKAGKGMVRFRYERRNHPDPVKFHDKSVSEFLHSGKPITVYHGTTSNFEQFDSKYMREGLLNQPQYVGNGFFFTLSHSVAYKYADSNRNSIIQYDEVFPLLKEHLPRELVGYASHYYHYGWGDDLNELLEDRKSDNQTIGEYLDSYGVDINTLFHDVVASIEGSHSSTHRKKDTVSDVFNLFSQSSSSGRGYIAEDLESMGINADSLRPKVLTCVVRANNVKLVKDLKEAKSAKREGYDAILWVGGGETHVGDEPEVVIFDPKNIRVVKKEVLKD